MESDWRNNGGIGIGDHRFASMFESPLQSASASASASKVFPIGAPPFPAHSSSSSCSPLSGGGVSVAVGVCVGGVNYIEHTVSKFDTLAGVAIKYGVEVADLKKINGLVTDRQMFALKTLHIPLPGRHPPSPILENGFDKQGPSSSEQTPPRHRHSDFFDSFQSLKLTSSPKRKVSPAMNNLQGYYGLKPPDNKAAAPEGCEMAVYRKGDSHYLEDGPFGNSFSPNMSTPLSLHRKSKSVANGFKLENGDLANGVSVPDAAENDSDNWISNLVRRRQKSENDFSRTPEKLLKEDNNTSSGGFSTIAGKGLALRPKSSSRTVSGADGEGGYQNSITTAVGDFAFIDISSGVKKSSSTSSLQDSDNSSSIWPTVNWSLKPDLQTAITRPIFDGLPKPITSRKNKTALD